MERETRILMDDGAEKAKQLVGQELEAWAPLSSATMEGFIHPYGFRVPGKIELGYTGQVSDTDPLLRTGKLRDSIQGDSEPTRDGVQGIIGSESKVALFQECGTVNRLAGSIPPRPFLAPALIALKGKSEEEFGELAMSTVHPGRKL